MLNKKAPAWTEYEILDSGNGRKLERFGSVILIRPEIDATWKPSLTGKEWKETAHGEFIEMKPGSGRWESHQGIPEEWRLSYSFGQKPMFFILKPTRFKHVGVFPEQTENWDYLYRNIRKGERLLNLFAHTGGASMAAALASADVTHVDSVYSMVGWARQNSDASDIGNIRWICEDSATFVEKEYKRGKKYHKIIMDPPTYGFSKKGRQWKIERDLRPLLKKSGALLEDRGEIILNCYSPRMGENRLVPLVEELFPQFGTTMETLVLPDRYKNLVNCGYLVRIRRS